MNSQTIEKPTVRVSSPGTANDEVSLRRPVIDRVLVGFGVVVTVALAVCGGLLVWGNNFSTNYVHDELGSQHVSFPPAAALTAQGRNDLLKYAGHVVDTGGEARAYASFINGHLNGIAGGKTYADLGAVETAAKADVAAAVKAAGAPDKIVALQATADGITNQRNTLFKGETLRGLLLSAYAWGTVGTIAGIAAVVLFVAAAGMAVLVLLGLLHLTRARPA